MSLILWEFCSTCKGLGSLPGVCTRIDQFRICRAGQRRDEHCISASEFWVQKTGREGDHDLFAAELLETLLEIDEEKENGVGTWFTSSARLRVGFRLG